jgi:magnesium transporter
VARSRRKKASLPAGASAVTVRLSRPGSDHCLPLPPEKISEHLDQPGALLWVEIRDPDPAAIELLREEFGFHRLALEDAGKQRQRPKVDEYPGYFFVVMYAAVPGAGEELETAEVDLFVGRNYVVSLHRGEVPALRHAMERWERVEPELREHVGYLVHTIADTVVDGYFPVVDALEDRLDDLELTMFRDGGNGSHPEALLGIKRDLFTLRKAIYPLREVFNVFLRRDSARFDPETYPYFQDVYDHVLRLLDTIDIQRDMVTGALDAHLAVVSNRLNETVKKLTVVAICLAILGAIFGAWGMNFDRIPLAHADFGFYAVVGGAVLLIAGALAWARRLGIW